MSPSSAYKARTTARNYVAGDWRESASGHTYEKRNPWRPSKIVGTYPASDVEDVRAAIEAAREAFRGWASLPGGQRATFLEKAANAIEARAEQIAQDMTAEMGKPVRESRLETLRAAAILRYGAGEAWRPIGEMYEPSVRTNACTRCAGRSASSASSPPGTFRSRSRHGSSRRRSSTATRSCSRSATRRLAPGYMSRSASARRACLRGC